MSESLDVTPEDLEGAPEVVGHIKNVKVFKAKTKGGLNLIFKATGEMPEILALAPHPAMAKFMAMSKNSALTWTELSKAEDDLPVAYFSHLIKHWENETEKWRALSK